ncbi:MAG: hypothetical protein MUE54_08315 [Anaerolineae bacterium]|nr:hypothetical protein [Anaerolineae bacterium]
MNSFKKFTFAHLIALGILPIFLALINPNWLFNLSFSHDYIIMVDDYIYTGYQMALPQYVGWYPSNIKYFIERLSWILPGYALNQVTTPLIAHVILHFALYYVAIFSVYGILNKLTNRRVALIIAVLFGQYPLIMRSLGWNYPDGFAMTCMLVSLLWLTHATESRWRALYVIGAGMAFMSMTIAHFFNIFYAPALILYGLLLDKLHQKPRRLIMTAVYSLVGAGVVYGGLAWYYHQLTGNILLSNALSTTEGFAQSLTYFLSYHFSGVPAYWHVFLVMIAIATIWFILRRTHTLSPETRRMMQSVLALFVGAYAVMAVWAVLGYLYVHVSFYHANIIMTAFLMLGMLIYKPLTDLPPTPFRWISITAFFAPMLLLILIPQLTINWDTLNVVLMIGAVAFGLMVIMTRPPMRLMMSLILFMLIASMLVGDSVLIKIYNPDRYRDQTVFEEATTIAEFLNERVYRLDMGEFRLWYDFNDPKVPTFHAVSSIYLWTEGRNARLNEEPPQSSFFEAYRIIIMSSVHDTNTLLQMASDTLDNKGIITFISEEVVAGIRLIFVNVRLALVSADWLTYYFSDTQQDYVLSESGWNGYEQVPQNSRPFRWMAEPTARLTLDVSGGWFDATANYRVLFTIAGYLEDEVVDNLTLSINGVPVPLERSADKYVGQISGQYLLNPTLELVFQTSRVSNPFDLGIQDGRKLGVALGELVIERLIE